MKYFYGLLKWQDFHKLHEKIKIDELDKYADLTLDNGISVRVSTGALAHTNVVYPYELNVVFPTGQRESYHKLNSSSLNDLLNEFDIKKF